MFLFAARIPPETRLDLLESSPSPPGSLSRRFQTSDPSWKVTDVVVVHGCTETAIPDLMLNVLHTIKKKAVGTYSKCKWYMGPKALRSVFCLQSANAIYCSLTDTYTCTVWLKYRISGLFHFGFLRMCVYVFSKFPLFYADSVPLCKFTFPVKYHILLISVLYCSLFQIRWGHIYW